jgi:hypothetical protein
MSVVSYKNETPEQKGSVMVQLALSFVRGFHFYMIPHSLAIGFFVFFISKYPTFL